jgi:Zn-finger nucleic acid-binding protein
MNCPVDGTMLTMSERQGIEIDYCPKCRGVWLDRGELDKIIERSSAEPLDGAQRPAQNAQQAPDYSYGGGHHGGHGRRGRRKSFLQDLFD